MKQIQLSKGMFALVDDEDYDWLNKWKWSVTQPKGNQTQYAQRSIYKNNTQRTVSMHRLILGVAGRSIKIDHIDHNGLNNQRNNIRICSSGQNQSNMQSHKDSTSKYVGVSWVKSKGRWQAAIGINYKVKQLGRFKTEREAAIAYNNAAIKYKGEFANINLL